MRIVPLSTINPAFPFVFVFFPVCLWYSRPAAERHRLQPDPAGALHHLPQSHGPPRGPQRHVCPHPAKAAEDRGRPLRQRGLLQNLQTGELCALRNIFEVTVRLINKQ